MDNITGDACIDLEPTETEVKELKRKPESSPASPDSSPLKKKCNKENQSPAHEENGDQGDQGDQACEMVEIDSTERDDDADEEVTEIKPPPKDAPELIELDDTVDDNTPGPDEMPTSEEKGFWKAVEENPNDFASWTYLLQVVEKNGKRKQIERAFSSFLALYPYCYGYWKKYADQMKKLVSPEACNEIFEEGVKAIPLSVDLWTYFIHFIAEWKQEDSSAIRLIYQRAVDACGKEFRSDKIWEAYVEWEKQNDKMKVLGVYKQLLGTIVQRHQRHYDRFREWLFLTPVTEMMSDAEIIELYNKGNPEMEPEAAPGEGLEAASGAENVVAEGDNVVAEGKNVVTENVENVVAENGKSEEITAGVEEMDVNEVKEEITEAEMTEATEPEVKDVPEAEVKEEEPEKPLTAKELADLASKTFAMAAEAPPPEPTILPLPPLPEELADMAEDQMTRVREALLEILTPLHEQTLADIKEVLPYEEAIRRPYFHVKELERAQLKNWKNYLNIIMEKQDEARIMILFERCLIACAFYEGFWLKYAHFLEEARPELASSVYRKACTIHLSKKPQIHLSWAAYEELQGNLDTAREALDHIEKSMPGLISVTLRRVGLERRRGNTQAGADLLKEAMDSARTEDLKEYWTVKYVNYAQNVLKNTPLARQVLKEAIGKSKDSKKLHMRRVELEMCQNAVPDVEQVEASFDSALESDLPAQLKVGFSQRKMCFLEENSDDIKKIMESYEAHHRNYRKYYEQKKKSEEKVKQEPSTNHHSSSQAYNQFTPYGQTGYGAQPQQGGWQSAQYQQWYAQQYAQYGYNQPTRY